MRLKKILMGILAITLLSTLCIAGNFSFSGVFTDANQIQYVTFTVNSGSKVVIQSYSYGGGTNVSGVTIQRGGFDPSIVLFRGTGSSAPVFKTTDDEYGCAQGTRDTVTNVCYDVYWEGTSQPTDPNAPVVAFEPGRYVIALTNYGNFNNGLTLGDGFSNTGSGFTCAGVSRPVAAGTFTDCTGNARDGHWALDIKGVETAELGIVKPKLIIAASDTVRPYGAENPSFAGTITGLENGDAISATYASTTDATTPVGNYAIVATVVDPAGKLANYDATVTNGTLTITAAPLSVTAANATRSFGQANPAFSGTLAGVQNGDNITATYSSAAVQTSAPGTYPITATLIDPAGKLSNYTVTSTNGTLTVVGSSPSAVSALPNAGTGASQLFQFTFSDPAGFASISSARVLFDKTTGGVNACAVLYTAATKSIQIINDTGIGWGAAAVLGSTGAVQNSQCSVDLATSSATGTGNDLVLSIATTFKPVFAGTKNEYILAVNKFGSSGYQNRGTWTIPAPPPVPPTPVSVTPSAGSGTSQLFQFTFSEATGFGAITSTRTLIGANSSGVNACGVLYTASTASIQVINDNGIGWSAAGKLGTAGTLQNGECSIDLATSSVSGTGTNLTLSLATTFNASFTGSKSLYMWAANKAGLNSGYQARGTWNIPASAPSAVSVTPSGGTGATTLQFMYSDPTGFASINSARALMGTNLSGINACAVLYTAATHTIQVINDNGVGWGAAGVLGAAGTLQNGQCVVDLSASSVAGSGNNLALNVALSFKPTFVGTKTIYMWAQNKFNLNSGYQTRGTWTP